jgi:branched-chain amino acid transport system permease protein
VWAAALLAALLVFPTVAPAYHVALGLALLADVAMASAWTLFSGPTRYLSLAAAAFYGVGAYVTALLGAHAVWPAPIVAGAAAGALLSLPVGLLALRLRGPYFAILTFGLSELVRHTVIWYESNVTGTVGRVLVLSLERRTLYWGLLVIAVAAVASAILVRRSRWGLALAAIGGDEERAEVLGIRPTGVKVAVFALSASLMGATGAAIAPRWTYLDPHIAFNPLISFQVIIMALLGGAGRPGGGRAIPGPAVRGVPAPVPLSLHDRSRQRAHPGRARPAPRPHGVAGGSSDRGARPPPALGHRAADSPEVCNAATVSALRRRRVAGGPGRTDVS